MLEMFLGYSIAFVFISFQEKKKKEKWVWDSYEGWIKVEIK